ncbi:MAG: response regulator transcription factor [Myxococcales bacterium]|nr:response regulator transcription factor [Myxococcales bacterium]
MSRILVVDDDGHIRDVMRFTLQQGGFQVVEAKDGAEALAQFDAGGIDLVVLDIVMPESDGLEVCRKIRAKSRLPIIFVSSRDEELDRVLGLELGADDYLVKPFSPRELLARVKAVLRRLSPEPAAADKGAICRRGALEMDLHRHRCTWVGQEVVLTVTEFALLQSLLLSPGRVFSRSELVDRAYGHGHVITERTVDSHIRRIRQKLSALSADPIETVYGLGYRLKESL